MSLPPSTASPHWPFARTDGTGRGISGGIIWRCAWVELRINKPNAARPKGMDITWRICRDCAGAGYFIVGDAAALLDPSSSHGVLKALMSGILFGHLAEACRDSVMSEAAAQAAYRSWVAQHFEHDEMRLGKLYADSPAGRHFVDHLSPLRHRGVTGSRAW